MVRFKAKIEVKVNSKEAAKAVAVSVASDNITAPTGLTVKTYFGKDKVFSAIRCKKSLETFLATMDDLLASIQLAEKTIKVV